MILGEHNVTHNACCSECRFVRIFISFNSGKSNFKATKSFSICFKPKKKG